MGVVKVTWLLNFGQISVISRKRYNIETYFQWKSNRKSYVAYRISPVLVTLNDLEVIPRLQVFSSAIRRTFCSILPDFNWQRARAVPQRQLGFLFSSVTVLTTRRVGRCHIPTLVQSAGLCMRKIRKRRKDRQTHRHTRDFLLLIVTPPRYRNR